MTMWSKKNERVEENYFVVFNDLNSEQKKLIWNIKKKMENKRTKKKDINKDVTRCSFSL